ncbi:MAG: hypothetical protein AMJ78_00885 [Omnitrophica WOR_2 bacterium SM23_29]|nr:MAG: hypothetical protein AMJ78_00885 [Omnitrophica WOR_2 bacterium SM23_29]
MPSEYLKGRERSVFLLNLVKKYMDEKSKILEIGCNVGRNLNELFCAGFKDLSGIEISKNALETMKAAYHDMAKAIVIYNSPVEDKIKDFEDNAFDVVFTMAVLEHIHTDSEFIFSHMARITKKLLITIEDEKGLSWRHFPRNYKNVFEGLGLKQFEEISFGNSKIPGLTKHFVCRIFKK